MELSCLRRITSLLVLLCGSASAQVSSDEVTRARAAFEKADRELNQAWAEIKLTLPEADADRLKINQRAWLEYRDFLALSPAYSGASADAPLTRESPDYLQAAAGITAERTEWLRGWTHQWQDHSLTGVWSDSRGGRLEIVEADGRLFFTISVARGHSVHTGDISGIAVWNSPLGWFSDKQQAPEKSTETNLAFIRRGQELEIVGANTQEYHGARAYFDGHYLKVSRLTAEKRDALMRSAEAEP